MKSKLVVSAIFLLGAASAVLLRDISISKTAKVDLGGVSKAAFGDHVYTDSIGEYSGEFVVYWKDSLHQTLSWEEDDVDGNEVTVENVDPFTGVSDKYYYSYSFDLQYLAAQTKDVFFVVGQMLSGDQVIEKWVHKPRKSQMPNGPIVYQLKRTGIYSGSSLGVIERIQVDPTGRFLVIAHNDGSRMVSQMSLSAGFTVTELLGTNEAFLLNDGIRALVRAEHVSEGLLWLVYLNSNSYEAVILRDVNADGVLDDWMEYDYPQMSAMYPSARYKLPWVDNFVDYPAQ